MAARGAGPPAWAQARAAQLLARFPELNRKLVDRGGSMRVLAAMSATPARAGCK
jgi:hypothetical protein